MSKEVPDIAILLDGEYWTVAHAGAVAVILERDGKQRMFAAECLKGDAKRLVDQWRARKLLARRNEQSQRYSAADGTREGAA